MKWFYPRKILGFFISFIILISFFLFSYPPKILGNVFFGEFSLLYNVQAAQFFFIEATNPMVGKVPEFTHYQLSRTYFIQSDFETALLEAHKELDLYPNNKRTYYILGLTYGYLHQEKEAIDAFSVFIENYPDSWAARNDKAWLQFRVGDIDGALTTIQPVVEKYKETPWVANTYGVLLLNKGKYKEAKESFQLGLATVTKMSPSDWGRAYPGNNPNIYLEGYTQTKQTLEKNLALANEKLKN